MTTFIFTIVSSQHTLNLLLTHINNTVICMHACKIQNVYRSVVERCHVAITLVVVYVTRDHVEVARGKEYGIARVERQVNHFSVLCLLMLILTADHVLPCTEDVPVCGDSCNKVCNTSPTPR